MFFCILVMHSVAATGHAFDFENVVKKAEELANAPHQPLPSIPRFMRELNYREYQNIRFNPESSLWRDLSSRFQVMLICPGLYYGHPVAINIIEDGEVSPLPFKRELFTFGDEGLARRIPPDMGYAGLKLTYPLKGHGEQNQFMVFAGASYFRGVGRDNGFGLSARGLALNTGLPGGEEFPSFVEFWLEKPDAQAEAMVFYGLMDSPSLTGAYSFTITPGLITGVKVKAAIFPRSRLELLGMAPLTSMFYYGENTSRPPGEWRRQVHDSDGLLIHNGISGEWLWRPLLNPKVLTMDYFSTQDVKGFGLLQRDDDFRDYLDPEARYHRRPSIWVEPGGNWGKGHVVLVQLPTPDETNDNIVAFWSPALRPEPLQRFSYDYTLSIGDASVGGLSRGRVINTFVGDGNRIGGGSTPGAYRVIVDFAGNEMVPPGAEAKVTASVTAQENGEIIDDYVEYIEENHSWRLSILAKPHEKKPLMLRAFLKNGDQALTETWNYRLDANNDIHKD